MTPLALLFYSLGLVAVTVTIHAAGLTLLLRVFRGMAANAGFWRTTFLLIRVICALVFVHVIEISVWAGFYIWKGCLPDAETAFYFSGVTYSTVGYGDIVLPHRWRMLGPIEGLAGILMCAWSAALFFALVNRFYASNPEHAD